MTNNKNILQITLSAATALAILITAIIFRQPAVTVVPLFISLAVSYLQSNVNRYGHLLGSLNSLLYAAIYAFYYRLYASAAYAVLFSFTIQLATYFSWKKSPSGKATMFNKLTGIERTVLAASGIAVWLFVFFIISFTDSQNSILDVTSSVLGIFVSFLTLFAFVEYAPLMIVSSLVSVALNVEIFLEKPGQITYIIFSVYCFLCQIKAYINVKEIFKKQISAGESGNAGNI